MAQLGPTLSSHDTRVAAAAPTQLLTLFCEQKELTEMHGLQRLISLCGVFSERSYFQAWNVQVIWKM